MHQRETQGVAYGGKQGDAWKGSHRRIGDGPESDGGDSGEESVEQNIRHDHSSESLTINKVADKPTAMQTISSMALTSRLTPIRTCPSMMSMTPLMSGTPGTRNSGLVAKVISAVQSKRKAAVAQSDATKAEQAKTRK